MSNLQIICTQLLKCPIIAFLLLGFLLLGCEDLDVPCGRFRCEIDTSNVLEWEDIRAAKITTMVDQTITVRSKMYWENNLASEPGITYYAATQPKLLFENADDFIYQPEFQAEQRGDLRFTSDEIKKYFDEEENTEKYVLHCRELSNSEAYYLLQGVIRYRNINLTQEQISSSAFIRQSNDVVYWSQTFEFVPEMICEEG